MLQRTALTIERDARTGHAGVRPYQVDDEQAVLEVLTRSLRRWSCCSDPVALWRWKHFANPFGSSCVLVHETPDQKIAGVVALMFWRLRRGGKLLLCERTTDLATHPDHRRKGVASSFWGPARKMVLDAGVSLVFHTPNQTSLGFTRNSNRPVFEMRPRFGMRNSARVPLALTPFAPRYSPDQALDPRVVFRKTPTPAGALLTRREALADLLVQDGARRGALLQTARTPEYIEWRYASHPTIQYYVASVETGGRLDGCAIFRVDRLGAARRLVVQELLMRPGADRTAHLIREQLDELVDCDLVQYFDAEGPWRDLIPGIAMPTWNSYSVTIGIDDQTLGRSPLDRDSWSLTLGDLQEI